MTVTPRALAALLALALLVAACTETPSPSPADPAPPGAPTSPGTAPQADAPAAVEAVQGIRPVHRLFRETTVACDNGLRCEVLLVGDDSSFGLVLRLLREPGPGGAQRLRLGTYETTPPPATLRLDTVASTDLPALPWRNDADANAWVLDTPQAIARFIDLVRDAGTLSMGEGDAAVSVSLAGFSAALVFVDEHQHRLDTRGAWLQRGDRHDADVTPAPALPRLPGPPPPLPSLTGEEVRSFADRVRDTEAAVLRGAECDAPRAAYDIRRNDDAQALDRAHVLVFVACHMGAYQGSSLVFRVARDGSRSERIVPPSPPGAGIVEVGGAAHFGLLTSAAYVPATGTLSHLAKGRGLGDCGEAATWRYDGQAFQLASYSALRRCGGAAPGDWPSLWRTAD
ncbi:DUF1176 domain-containing protein [Luteimonas deserti]|uniref:DUF1176 domain-containing protein n=1 Tax=Luteimonas deserti TaxID=2752306 RepID=A0A7Z0QN69_9GAMM|nr:DUF1176 domain-containing protein [Luteimonas deserti]NYZ61736.1 DUF1176 domain-containing protein [Luteimonas deserti]